MASWGKRKDGQAYPKNNTTKSKKRGSTKSSGIKLTPKFIPSIEEQPDQKRTRLMIINEYGNLTPTEIMIKPTDFLRATNNDKHWIPFDKPRTIKKLKNRMEKQLPIDIPILVYDPNPDDPHDINAEIHGQIKEHEGRHRAYVAMKEHIPEILVDVYCVKHGILNHNCKVDKDTISEATSQSPNDKQIDKGRDNLEKEWEREKKQHAKLLKFWKEDNAELLKGRKKIVAVFGEKLS